MTRSRNIILSTSNKDLRLEIFNDSEIIYYRDEVKYALTIRPILGFYNNYNLYNVHRGNSSILFYSKFFEFEINLKYKVYLKSLDISVSISLSSNRKIVTLDFPYPIIIVRAFQSYRIFLDEKPFNSPKNFKSIKLFNKNLSIKISFEKIYLYRDKFLEEIEGIRRIKVSGSKIRIENLLSKNVLLNSNSTLNSLFSINIV